MGSFAQSFFTTEILQKFQYFIALVNLKFKKAVHKKVIFVIHLRWNVCSEKDFCLIFLCSLLGHFGQFNHFSQFSKYFYLVVQCLLIDLLSVPYWEWSFSQVHLKSLMRVVPMGGVKWRATEFFILSARKALFMLSSKWVQLVSL